MKKILILLIIILTTQSAIASQDESKATYNTYTGLIANKYPITAFLIFSKDEINGRYFYNETKKYIELKGNLKDNKIILKEYSLDKNYDKQNTGVFEGILNDDNSISGTWKTPDNTKKLSYNLQVYYNPASDFKYNGKFIHPEILETLINTDTENEIIDIAGTKTTEKMLSDENKITIKHPTWPAIGGEPFFSYEIIAQRDNIYFLNTAWNGGGTGHFSNLVIINRVNNILFTTKDIAGGDRANGGLNNVHFKNGYIYYSQYITPYDIYTMGTKNNPKLEAYKDLECSANSYFGAANYELDIKNLENTLIDINLSDEKMDDIEGWTDMYQYQKCFNTIYNSYVENKKTKLNQEEINKFNLEFINKCINKFNLSCTTEYSIH